MGKTPSRIDAAGSAEKARTGRCGWNRVHYVRPEYDVEPSSGKWASFAYTINDGTSTSKAATVTLVGPSRRVVASPYTKSRN